MKTTLKSLPAITTVMALLATVTVAVRAEPNAIMALAVGTIIRRMQPGAAIEAVGKTMIADWKAIINDTITE